MSNSNDVILMRAAELADLLRACPQYDAYMQAKQSLMMNPENVQLLAGFRSEQMKLHMHEMLGEDISAQIGDMDNYFNTLYQNEDIAAFIDAEADFSMIMQEVQEILTDVLNVWSEDDLCIISGPAGNNILN